MYLVLFGTGTAGALAAALYVQDPAAVVAALLPTGAGAYLAWSAYRADRIEAAVAESPAAVAERLALVVRRQWETEAQVRRLEDPYPLPVSWRPADVDLAEVALAGGAGEIGEVFEGLPGRRLLVLGDPGSGKTVLLVRLLLALIARRQEGEPVPVLFPLASWDPAAQDLRGWMERRLVQDHAELGAVGGGRTLAGALLDRRLVLPVLDGFDELPSVVAASALHGINEALPYGCGLVLSSRPSEYRAALRPRDGVPARLREMAGIRLEPLGAGDVAEYLLQDAGGEGTSAAARWRPVVEVLDTDVPVARALTSPLMVSLARSVYNPRPGERTGELPDPADLLLCPARESVADHLFEAFVDAAYRPHPCRPSRWTAAQARTALRFLARRMERGLDGAAEVAWWGLNAVVPGALMRVLAGLLLGTLGWLLESGGLVAMHQLTQGRVNGNGPEAAGAFGVMAAGICSGLVGGLTATVVTTGLNAVSAWGGLSTGLVLNRLADGIAMTLVGMVVAGFADRPGSVLRPPSAWDRRAALAGVAAGCLYLAGLGNGHGVTSALLYGILAAAVGADGPQPHRAAPVARARWSWNGRGVALGCLGGAVLGAVYFLEALLTGVFVGRSTGAAATPSGDPVAALWFAAQEGAVLAVACLLLRGMRMAPVDLGGPVEARALLRNDRRILAACAMTATLLGTMVIGAQAWLVMVAAYPVLRNQSLSALNLWLFVAGLIPAALMALAAALRQTAWPCYTVARHYLALRSGLPRDFIAFLADAHEQRGVLRRVGAVYQFRHIELQHHLADRER